MLTHHKAFLFHTHIMIQFCWKQARRQLMRTCDERNVIRPQIILKYEIFLNILVYHVYNIMTLKYKQESDPIL